MTQPLLNNASFARRLAAAFYDTLLVASLIIAGVALSVMLGGGKPPETTLLRLFLLLIAYLFFTGFWVHGGQTLGMRAWNLRVVDVNGHTLRWPRASLRFLALMLTWVTMGVGFAWMLVDSSRLALHDRLSATRIIHDTAR